MNRKKIITGISLLAVAGIYIYVRRRHRANMIEKLKSEQVAEHGYETAHDILFPKRQRRIKRYRHDPRWR